MIIFDELSQPKLNAIHNCDALRLLGNMPSQSVNCIVTSPPYFGLRDYGMAGQIGLEETPAAYVAKLVELFREARRVLRDDGTFWLNLGDSYNNSGMSDTSNVGGFTGQRIRDGKKGIMDSRKRNQDETMSSKNLLGIPWRVAFGLQDDGWILRSDIIWAKPNPMPESVTDRPTKAHEYVFLFAKSQRYWYDADAIKEPSVGAKHRDGFRGGNGRPYVHDSTFDNSYKSHKNLDVPGRTTNSMHEQRALGNDYTRDSENRNRRSVWTVSTEPTPFAHFATFPAKLIEPMILAGCPLGGVVFDPFMGSGTTAMVARDNGRNYIGSELNPAYVTIAQDRLDIPWQPMFAEMLA